MKIEIFADGLERRDICKSFYRQASRGIILHEDKMLLVYVPKLDIYTFPGGGLEDNESKIDCLKREILEETGYVVTSYEEKSTVIEYFVDSTWENTYFVCKVDFFNRQMPALTSEEIENGIEYHWMSNVDALNLLDSYESTNEHGANILNREFIGLINSL
jgi:8-oxo-dGTP pyrophosphatase MutT (NUDIX family)